MFCHLYKITFVRKALIIASILTFMTLPSMLDDPAVTGPLVERCEPLARRLIRAYRSKNKRIPYYIIHDAAFDSLLTATNNYEPSRGSFPQRAQVLMNRGIQWAINNYRKTLRARNEIIGNYEGVARALPESEDRDFARHVASYLDRPDVLDERDAVALRGLFLHGLTLRKMGEEMGFSYAGVAKIRDRALERLRIYMFHFGDRYVQELARESLILSRRKRDLRRAKDFYP